MREQIHLFRGRLWPVTVFAAFLFLASIGNLIGWKPDFFLAAFGTFCVCLNFQHDLESVKVPKFVIWVLVAIVSILVTFIISEILTQRFAIVAILLGTASVLLNEEFRWRIWPLFFLALSVEACGIALFIRGLYPESFSFGVLLYGICRLGIFVDGKLSSKKIPELDPEEFLGI